MRNKNKINCRPYSKPTSFSAKVLVLSLRCTFNFLYSIYLCRWVEMNYVSMLSICVLCSKLLYDKFLGLGKLRFSGKGHAHIWSVHSPRVWAKKTHHYYLEKSTLANYLILNKKWAQICPRANWKGYNEHLYAILPWFWFS